MPGLVVLLFRLVRLKVSGRRAVWSRDVGGRRAGAAFALAVPLLFSGVAPGLGAHFPVPTGAQVRASAQAVLDALTGQHAAAPPNGPAQQSAGAASAHPGQVPAAVTRAVERAEGSAPVTVPGAVPAYQVHTPSFKPVTTGPEAGGEGTSYNAATSVLVQAGTNATTDLFKNADGTYTERIYAVPVNAKKPDGTWAKASGASAASGAQGNGAGPLPVGYNGSGQSTAVVGLPTAGLAGVPAGFHITAASLHLFDVSAASCTAQSSITLYAVPGQVATGSAAAYPAGAAPATGEKLGAWAGTAPTTACAAPGTSAGAGAGDWITVPLNSDGLAALRAAGSKGIGLAIEAPASDGHGWKEFAGLSGAAAVPASSPDVPSTPEVSPSQSPSPSVTPASTATGTPTASLTSYVAYAAAAGTSAAQAPFVEMTAAAVAPPDIAGQYPPDNYTAATLTPELGASSSLPSGATGPLTYSFSVFSTAGTLLASASNLSASEWTVPAGKLAWNQTYYWTTSVADSTATSTTLTISYFSTPVPQPLLTSELSQQPAPGYDPQTGDWTTSATDAQIASVGPALEVTRDYNSEDPRTSGAFGAGWSSVLDMSIRPGQPNTSGTTQTEVVTYPDGQEVGYGLNSNGSYSPPPGRYAALAAVSGGFSLTDKNDTVYTFTQSLSGSVHGITSIKDAENRTETFTWNAAGQVTKVTSASGRSLNFTWGQPSGAVHTHVASVTTDPVTSGNAATALTWTYSYAGDTLTGVCAPGSGTQCTRYAYQPGTDYQNALLDTVPRSYWRFDDPVGNVHEASSVLLNEGTDGTTEYNGVAFGSDTGPLAGSSVTAATFNGTSSYVYLLGSPAYQAAYQSVGLWFKTTSTGGVLFSMSAGGIGATTTASYDPVLYVGSDGKLQGEFWDGSANTMASSVAVDDGKWHNAVITDAAGSEYLYLDGTQIGTLTSGLSVQTMTHVYVGAGFLGGGWPDESHNTSNSNTGYASYFNGDISDAAVWDRQLTGPEVASTYQTGHAQANLLTSVTRPTGSVYEKAAYDPATSRVTSVTDSNGGTWSIPAPTVRGSSQVYVASVLGSLPQDYYRLAEAGTSTADNQLQGGTATYNNVTQGVTSGSLFSDEPVDSFNGSSSYLALPQGLTYKDGAESVGLWFKTTTAGGSLFSAAGNPLAATTSGGYSGGLYIGSDGKLVGGFFDGDANDVVKSPGAVDDGNWHFAVLSADATGQSVYLDGNRLGTLSAGLDAADETYAFVGAGFLGGGWPDEPHNSSSSSTGYASYFNGDIAEVAWYHGDVTSAQVSEQYSASKYSAGLTPVQYDNVTDPGGKTLSYAYDLLNGGRTVAETNADLDVTTFGYDENGFQDRVVDPNGNVTDSGYDPRGNMISQQTCQNQTSGVCSTERWTYYPDDTNPDPAPDPRNDQITSYKDGRTGDAASSTQYQTTYTYDTSGNLASVTTPPTAQFPNGQTTGTSFTDGINTFGGYSAAIPPKGLPWRVQSPGGAVTRMLHDAAGDIMQETDPNGLVTDMTYDGLGRLTSKTEISDSYPAGVTTTYAYNGTGQVTTETDPQVLDRVNGAQHDAVTTTSYDADGDVLSQTVSDASGGDASRTASYTYNANDLVETATDPAGGVTHYTYDPYGDKASETDPNGDVYNYAYNAEGQLVTQTLANYSGGLSGAAAGPLVETSRAYDRAGRLATITDAMGFVTTYGYTDNNLVASVTRSDPATGSSYVEQASTYDAAGNLVKQVTNNGATETDSTIDAGDHVTSQVLDPANLDRVTNYTYTPDDGLLTKAVSNGPAAVSKGQPSGPVQVTGYAYDGTGATAAQQVYGDTSPAQAPAAWWPLNDGTAASQYYTPATAADESGNGNAALADPGVTWSGASAAFSGDDVNDPQLAASGPVINTAKSFTVSAWVKLASDNGQVEGIASDHSAQEDGFRLDYYAGSWEFARPAADTSGTPALDGASASGAATGTWTHLVGTYNASTGAMTLYVNGQQADTGTDTTPFAASGPFAIGTLQYEGGVGNPFDGQIANVQAYSYALSAAQVSSLYGEGQSGTPAGMQGATTAWTLDQRGLPTSMTDPDGNVTGYSYDQAGRLAVTTAPSVPVETYNASTRTDTTVTARPVETTGYDTFGDAAETENANGDVTTYGYDADGRQDLTVAPDYTPADGSGPYTKAAGTSATSTQVYDDSGQLTKSTDPLGNTTKYSYDQLGDLVSQTAPDGGATNWTYDPNGDQLSVTGPTGAQVQSTYDYLGRKLTSTQLERYPQAASYTTDYAYTASASDPGGAWASGVTSPDGTGTGYAYNAAGETTSVSDGAGNVTGYSYDALGRGTASANPDGTSSTTAYDPLGDQTGRANLDASGKTLSATSAAYDPNGNLTSSTDPNGNTTTFSHDPTGMLVKEVQPVSATSSITTSFGYDAAGDETRYTDGDGNAWYTTYTPWGQQESQAEPATSQYSSAADSTFTLSYNAAGEPVTEAQPGGVTLTSSYNDMGEVTGQAGAGATAATASRSFGYDHAGNLLSAATTSTAPSGATSNATSEQFTYDDRGLPLTASGSGGSTTLAYNGDGLETSVADAAGTTSFTYDTADRLKTLSDPLTGTTATYSYNQMSQVSGISYGTGGDTETLGYDTQHRLTSQTLATASGATVASLNYGYDADGNTTSIDTAGLAGPSSNTYSYDEADRLTSWDNGTTTTGYSYDGTGNMTGAGSKTYTYDARGEVTSDGTNSYSYSANGTLASVAGTSGTTASTFDAYGAQASAGGQSYSYDALGRLTTDSGAGAGYTFSYLGASQSLASDESYDYTWDPSGTALAGTAPAGTAGSGGTTGAVLALTNQHGDVVGQFTGSGTALAGSRSYDPWGTATGSSGSVTGNLGYQSGWTEPVTGNVHMGARWYSPATGGFTSKDTAHVSPVPDSGAASPFGYAGDNPLGNTDPSGHYISAGSAEGGAAAPESEQEQVETSIVRNQAQEAEQGRLSAAQNAVNAARSLLSSFGDVVHGMWDFVTGNWSGAKAAAEAALGRARAALASAEAAAGEIESAAVRSAENEYVSFEKQMQAAERAVAARIADAKKKALEEAAAERAKAAAELSRVVAASARTYHSVTVFASEGGSAVVHAVGTAVHAVGRATTATAGFVKAHAGAVTSIVVSVAVMAGCEATLGVETFGAATMACGAISGAAGAAAGYAVNAAEHGGFSWSGLGEATAAGAAAGLVGGVLGKLGGQAAKGLGLGGGLAAMGGAARSVASGLLSSGDSTAESALASAAVDDAGGALADGSAAQGADPGDTYTGPGGDAQAAPGDGSGGGDGASCGGQSFTAGTLVLLATGKAVPIATLKAVDKVLAEDTRTGKDQPETVTAVLVHHDTDLYDLKVKTTSGIEVVHTTSSHLFWDPYLHYGWIQANHLKSGMHLKTQDGQSAVVVGGSVPAVHDGWMWDLTVPGNDDHDFYVQDSGTGVLVHNCGEGVSGTVSALKGVFAGAFNPVQLGIGAAGGAAGNYLDAHEDGERGAKLWETTALGAVTGAVSNVGVGDGLGPSMLMGGLAGDINGTGSQLISNGGNIRKLNMGWVAVDTGIGAWGNAVGTGIQGDDANPTLGNSMSAFMGLWPSALCGGLDNSQNWNC